MSRQLQFTFDKNTKSKTKKETTVTTIKTTPKIFDETNTDNVGILYWKQETLEAFTKKSGPLAKSNEFQIHYWALVARITFDDSSIVDIAFPTVIFNYKQEVTSGHIDFELKDVSAMSKALQPVHNVVVNKNNLKEQIKSKLSLLSKNIEFISVPMNTLHRHPTGVSSFSSTDLGKSHTYNTGVVFPLKTGNKTPSFSSIIYNNPVKLIHTEYRVASGNVEEKGIQYSKGRSATFVQDSVSTVSSAEQWFEVKPKDRSYVVTKDSEISTEGIISILKTINYEPSTDFVKEENLIQKVYQTSYFSTTKKYNKKKDNSLSLSYDPNTVKNIKAELKLDIIRALDLEKMHDNYLKTHCLKLEQHYYTDATLTLEEYKDLKKKDLIELALELQDLVIYEFENDSTVDTFDDTWYDMFHDDLDTNPVLMSTKREELIKLGADVVTINSASEDTINKWYTEMFE